MDPCTRKFEIQIELHRNNVYQSVELLLLVPMLVLLAIPKCLLIFKENFYYTSIYTGILQCMRTVVYCIYVSRQVCDIIASNYVPFKVTVSSTGVVRLSPSRILSQMSNVGTILVN